MRAPRTMDMVRGTSKAPDYNSGLDPHLAHSWTGILLSETQETGHGPARVLRGHMMNTRREQHPISYSMRGSFFVESLKQNGSDMSSEKNGCNVRSITSSGER